MIDVKSILSSNYPDTIEKIEGKLVFLPNQDVDALHYPILSKALNLNFFKARFSTGYRKFRNIDVVVGVTGNSTGSVYLLTNPLIFSERYSDLIDQLEKITKEDITADLLNEIIALYKETGVHITPFRLNSHKYQIWFGENKWRILKFEFQQTLKIITRPNYISNETLITRLKKFFLMD